MNTIYYNLENVKTDRLNMVADMLEIVPSDQFDLSYWEKTPYTPPTTKFFGLYTVDKGCGFAGCAMGWAAHLKLFEELEVRHGELLYKRNTYSNGFFGWTAVRTLFGIDDKIGSFLFSPDSYRHEHETTPADVAIRIRRFVHLVELGKTVKQRRTRQEQTTVVEIA